MPVADKTYYLNADKSRALPVKSAKEGEDDTPDGAAYLLVREGQEVTDEMVEKYGVKGVEPGVEEAAAEEDAAETSAPKQAAKKATSKKK